MYICIKNFKHRAMKRKDKVGGFKTPIWKACGTDGIRPVMEHAFIKEGYVYVTNAYVAIKQSLEKVHGIKPDEVENLEGKFLHRNLLKELDRASVVIFQKDCIEAIGPAGRVRYEYSYEPGKYPNVDAVIPPEGVSQSISDIKINPSLFKLMSDVMVCDEVLGFNLTFYGETMAIILTSGEFERSEQLGLVMPIQK